MPWTSKHKSRFGQALGDWYREAQRPLPWRTQPGLYRTVVSEFMAQQTQIKTMLPHYERWMRRFPDFKSLAEAPSEDVLKHWEGLGYYNRARNLQKLAIEYIALKEKPSTAEQWQELPGVGPYTAAAISSIAQNYPTAVVDGNVIRILSRLENDTRSFANQSAAAKALNARAQDLLDRNRPGNHNQAMMELGATICLKQKPLCSLCPVIEFCRASKTGNPGTLPKIARKTSQKVEIDRLWITRSDKILLHRIPLDASLLAGQYELPQPSDLNVQCPQSIPISEHTRAITHRRIRERIYRYDLQKKFSNQTLFWIPVNDLDTITLSGPHRRWVEELLSRQAEAGEPH